MTLGEKIKDRRLWLGISGQVLAEQVGRTQGTVSGWENGRTTPPREMIGPLCKALNVPADYFDDVLPPVTYRDIAADCLLFDPTADMDWRVLDKCRHTNCATCGWYAPEQARRNEMVQRHGLERLGNGLLGLKVGSKNEQTEKA